MMTSTTATANQPFGMSGRSFDAFVSSQRTFNHTDWATKIQEKYWRARQKFLAKIEKKEDSCIVLSDSKLDSKLEIYHSIDRSCSRLISILESYQNSLFNFANEENALGALLKECGKHDKTKAGKVMSLTGKSLTQSSQQRIRLYMPILRFYQEMETFHSRAVEDTSETVSKLEDKRSQYRASLLWMKNLSDKLDPDVYEQLDKFRRVQCQVREDKQIFDGVQMDVVQKIDLLMASRCNLINQILAPYQTILLETFEKNSNNFKSVEQLISKEDFYDYEFKTLKQLNPLKLSESDSNQSLEDDNKQQHHQDSNNNNTNTNEDLLELNDNDIGGDVDLLKEENDLMKPPSSLGAQLSLKHDSNNLGDLLNFDFGHQKEKKQDSLEKDLLGDMGIAASSRPAATALQAGPPTGLGDNLLDLLVNELDEIDNSSYFKSLQKLQI